MIVNSACFWVGNLRLHLLTQIFFNFENLSAQPMLQISRIFQNIPNFCISDEFEGTFSR